MGEKGALVRSDLGELPRNPVVDGRDASAAPPGNARNPQRSWRGVRANRLTRFALVTLTVFGAALRVRGLSTGGLWRDDAWVALSAHVGLGTAWHMFFTAPGFFLLERTWISLLPTSTVWAQIPPLLIGIAGVPATFALIRYFRFGRWIALGAALTVAVSPVCVIYSSRLKESGTDFLVACLLLAAAEAARRRFAGRELWRLAVVSVVGFACCASVLPVVVGVWFALGLVAPGRPGVRRTYAAAASVAALACATIAAVFDRHLSPADHRNWAANYLVYSSPHAFVTRLHDIVLSLSNQMVAVWSGSRWGPTLMAVTIIALIVLGLGRRRDMTGPALVIAAALVACALGAIPLGGGRTDEALYPALLVLIAAGIERVSRLLSPLATSTDRTRLMFGAVGAALVALMLAGGAQVEAAYPATDVTTLAPAILHHLKPGDHLAVDELMRYPWALYEDPTPKIEFGTEWAAGFTVKSTDPRVFIAPSEFYEGGSDPSAWTKAMARYSRLWFVETAPLSLSPFYRDLRAAGWNPVEVIQATGCGAILLERSPT